MPAQTLDDDKFFFICRQKLPNWVTFPKIYLGTIWCKCPCSSTLTLPFNHFVIGSFSQNLGLPILYKKDYFLAVTTFLDYFSVLLLSLTTLWCFSEVLKRKDMKDSGTKMAGIWEVDVIPKWCEVIGWFCGPQGLYYLPSKFRCHSFKVFGVKEGRVSLGSRRAKKS